jgi:D-inositol-3-phosphate glycosyltransferase
MHTMAKVKNEALAEGDTPEPLARVIGEEQVVEAADLLIANTAQEAQDLVSLYDAQRVLTVAPGVDLEHFRLGEASAARTRLGVPPDATLLLFVGRLQPLKAPDVLIRAAALMRGPVHVAIVGGLSGSAVDYPQHLQDLASSLGVSVTFAPPAAPDTLRDWYTAADLVAVPSFNESFGLVALEAQACGTPVVATRTGGLLTTVADGRSGILVEGHDAGDWAAALERALARPELRQGALEHASHFSWNRTADGLLAAYRQVLAPAMAS